MCEINSEINEIDIQLFKEENMEGPEQCPDCGDKDWYCDWCRRRAWRPACSLC